MSKNTQISELINYISVDSSGNVVFTMVASSASNTDKFLVSDSGVLKYRTAAQLLSDIGAQASGNYQAALTNPVTGTGTANYLPKFIGSTSIANSLIFDNGTNVLIGTTTAPTPVAGVSFPLSVTSSAATRIRIDSTQATPNSGFGLYANSVQKWSIAMFGTGSDFTIYNDALLASAILVKGASSNVLVGYGTSTADTGFKLDVNGTGRFSGALTGTSSVFSSTITSGGNYLINNPTASKKGYTYQSPASNWGPQVSGLYFTPNNSVDAQTTFTVELWNGLGSIITPLTISSSGAATFLNSITATNSVFTSGTIDNSLGNGALTLLNYSAYNTSANQSITLGLGLSTAVNNNIAYRYVLTVGGNASGQILTLSSNRRGVADLSILTLDGNTGAATFSNSIVAGTDFRTDGGSVIVGAGANSYYTRLTTVYNYPYVDSYLDSMAGSSYDGRLIFRIQRNGGSVNPVMTLTPEGNVAIGTNTSDSKIAINGGSTRGIRIDVNSGIQAISISPNGIFGVDEPGIGNGRFIINTNGFTGFGNSNPQHRIHASGNIYSTDTVFARNLKPEAFAAPAAGTPTGATIPQGYSSMVISSPCDNQWRPLMNNLNDVKGYFWVTLGDAASKDTANYIMSFTSPAYGVSNFGAISYQDNGWNTGGFEFSYDSSNGTYRLLVRCTSYYNSGNTAYGSIYFLRLE